MNFVEMRHPCLERQDGTCFIPNDVRLSSGIFFFDCIKFEDFDIISDCQMIKHSKS